MSMIVIVLVHVKEYAKLKPILRLMSFLVLHVFKHYLKYIPTDIIVSCIDFFENYAMKVQNEIQDMHWFSFQITIFVHISYCHNPNYDPTIDKTIILKEVDY
jgi:hypothetical protein